jgi:hypothetical protein
MNQTRDGSVNTGVMRANLDTALRDLGLPTDYSVVDLDGAADSGVQHPMRHLLFGAMPCLGLLGLNP